MSLAIDPEVGVDIATDAVARAMKAGADAARVHHAYTEVFEVNFDTNDVTLVRTTVGDTLAITAFDETRKGSTQLTGRAHDMVERGVAQALEAARAGEPDPANVLPSEPAAVSPRADDGDAEPDREAMVDAVLRHIERTRAEFPSLRSESSHYSFSSTWMSYANSHDRVQHSRRARYMVSTMVTGKDEKASTSFNYVGLIGRSPFGELTTLAPMARLFDSTMASFDARPVPSTFVGDVIFTPEAMSTLVGTVAGALGGLALMRKATPFLDSVGEQVAAAGFSLLHRPSAVASAAAFDSEGFLNEDLDIIRDGVLENFLIDWYSAHKLDRPMTTGSADFVVAPGDTALDDIIANTERGIVLGRYSGGMPNQNLDFSGVAKNSFYVEDGKISHALSETMVAGNFVAALQAIRGISRETVDFGSGVYPWVATTGVTVSTK